MNEWTINNIAELLANKLDKTNINGILLFFIKSDYIVITLNGEEVFYMERNMSNAFYIEIGEIKTNASRNYSLEKLVDRLYNIIMIQIRSI